MKAEPDKLSNLTGEGYYFLAYRAYMLGGVSSGRLTYSPYMLDRWRMPAGKRFPAGFAVRLRAIPIWLRTPQSGHQALGDSFAAC
jgi:hypothetical protein